MCGPRPGPVPTATCVSPYSLNSVTAAVSYKPAKLPPSTAFFRNLSRQQNLTSVTCKVVTRHSTGWTGNKYLSTLIDNCSDSRHFLTRKRRRAVAVLSDSVHPNFSDSPDSKRRQQVIAWPHGQGGWGHWLREMTSDTSKHQC